MSTGNKLIPGGLILCIVLGIIAMGRVILSPAPEDKSQGELRFHNNVVKYMAATDELLRRYKVERDSLRLRCSVDFKQGLVRYNRDSSLRYEVRFVSGAQRNKITVLFELPESDSLGHADSANVEKRELNKIDLFISKIITRSWLKGGE